MAAILDFIETCNTKNVHIYIIDQRVKFRGHMLQFKIASYSPPLKLMGPINDFEFGSLAKNPGIFARDLGAKSFIKGP